ncbi:MAG: S-adenosylmethionine:tRNA ribosyltransferase-isomerase [Muribaculaceae bacterium]|nr:S-adenosylmethionine:tRNA ribosyltransferase-isomerase [Muribaculaceae bacterium]
MHQNKISLSEVENIQIADFDYPLPDLRIAKHPLSDRASCRLLVSRARGECLDMHFSDLPALIGPESLLVRNETRVINARVRFTKDTGANIEVFLLEPIEPHDYVLMFQSRNRCSWSCLVGNHKKWKGGKLSKTISINGEDIILTATRGESLPGNAHEIIFEWSDDKVTFADVIEAAGYIPIPPYLHRDSEESDAEDYQTVYARSEGSVAAPTAGLHFTPELFQQLSQKGVRTEGVTLHVGAGTFQPVKSDAIGQHPMHTETFSINKNLLSALINALKSSRVITAVGTTSVRTLESLPYLGRAVMQGLDPHVNQWEAYSNPIDSAEETLSSLEGLLDYMKVNQIEDLAASTAIMIAPGFQWNLVGAMITNFHQPQSTLLLLVSSFLGTADDGSPRWRILYNHALEGDYRFLSYGDACYFERGK